MPWETAERFHAYVREHGVIQFLNIYTRVRGEKVDRPLLWGEEIEFLICKVRSPPTLRSPPPGPGLINIACACARVELSLYNMYAHTHCIRAFR